MVPDIQAIEFSGAIAATDHLADEFVTRGYRRLAIPNAMFIAPKERSSGVTFNITGAHPGAFDFEEHFAGPWLRDRTFLHTVIVRPVGHHGWHRFR
jgi:hypothetical protein